MPIGIKTTRSYGKRFGRTQPPEPFIRLQKKFWKKHLLEIFGIDLLVGFRSQLL